MKPSREFGCVELMGKCPYCAVALPINRPQREIQCPSCKKTVRLKDELWKFVIEKVCVGQVNFGHGVVFSEQKFVGGMDLHYDYGRDRPVCPACGKKMRLSADGQEAKCTECEWSRPVEPAPGWMKRYGRNIVGFVSDAVDQKNFVPEKPTAEDTHDTVSCVHCEASIGLDSSTRSFKCTYCGTVNVLSDQMWNRLRPPTGKQRWFVASLIKNDPRRRKPDVGKVRSMSKVESNAWGTLLSTAFGLTVSLALPIVGTSALVDSVSYFQNDTAMWHLILSVVFFWLSINAVAAMGVAISDRRKFNKKRKQHRDRNRQLLVYTHKNEMMGIINGKEGKHYQLGIFAPGNPPQKLDYVSCPLNRKKVKKLGGVGAVLRAFYDKDKKRSFVVEQPSVLDEISKSDTDPWEAIHGNAARGAKETKPPVLIPYLIYGLGVLAALLFNLSALGMHYNSYVNGVRMSGRMMPTGEVVDSIRWYGAPILVDLNGDGLSEVIGPVQTRVDGRSKTLFAAYDTLSGKNLWVTSHNIENFSSVLGDAVVVGGGLLVLDKQGRVSVFSVLNGKRLNTRNFKIGGRFCGQVNNFVTLKLDDGRIASLNLQNYQVVQKTQLKSDTECLRNFYAHDRTAYAALNQKYWSYKLPKNSRRKRHVKYTKQLDTHLSFTDGASQNVILLGGYQNTDLPWIAVFPRGSSKLVSKGQVAPIWQGPVASLSTHQVSKRKMKYAGVSGSAVVVAYLTTDYTWRLTAFSLVNGARFWDKVLFKNKLEALSVSDRQIFVYEQKGSMSRLAIYDLATGNKRLDVASAF